MHSLPHRCSIQVQTPPFPIVSNSTVKPSSLMPSIFITADYKDVTILQKQSYQRKKSEKLLSVEPLRTSLDIETGKAA